MKGLVLFLLIVVQVFSRKLMFVQNLFRHGARYPVFLNPDDFTKQPRIANHVGELTPQGKSMHYMLGKIFYKKYWKALFGGTQAEFKVDHKQIYVKSTNVNRTIESVQSQLRGWLENLTPLSLEANQLDYSLPAFQNITDYLDLNYTKNGWNVFNEMPKYQTIPIHTGLGGQGISSSNPYDEGDFLLKFDQVNCPQQQQWIAQNYKSQMAKEITNHPQIKQALAKLSQAFPSQNVTFQNAYKYIDNYVCMQYLGEPTLKIFQDPKYEKTLRYLKEVSMYLSLFFQPIQYQTTGTNLFENIVNNLKSAIAGTGPRLILYSAHDTTVGMTLAVFNLTNVACINDKYLRDLPNEQTCASDYPRFASNFIIQLYQEDNGTYTFDIVFNNIQRRIPFCNWQFSCQVQKFYQWVDGWKIQDPNEQCGIQDEFKVKLQAMKKNILNSYVVIAVAVLIILVQFIWIIGTCVQQNKQKKRKQGYIENFEQKQMGHHPNPTSEHPTGVTHVKN